MADSYVNSTRVSAREELHPTSAVPVGAQKNVGRSQSTAEQELHRLTQRLMRVRDDERRALARELHQSAGQSLAALKMVLGNLREALPKRNRHALSLLETCYQLTEDTVREIRTVSYLMHPPMLDEAGLPLAIRWYAREFSARSKIDVTVGIPEDFGRLPRELETAIFRLIQESLTNAYRYSGSRNARILLAHCGPCIRVEVSDSGCGLPRSVLADTHSTVGVGIAGMRERVHELNGTFEIESAPRRGTTVRALLPCPPCHEVQASVPARNLIPQNSGCADSAHGGSR